MTARRMGIVGGVGPLAAAHFYRLVIELSPVGRDEDHVPVVLVAEPIPSRIDHLLGRGRSPVPALQQAVRALTVAGVTAIAVPSATTHAYRPDMQAVTHLPILDLLGETGHVIRDAGFRQAMILATRPTTELGLYEPHLGQVVARYPSPSVQDTVERIIAGVKRGDPLDVLQRELAAVVAGFTEVEDACVVLGCTELSVVAPATSSNSLPVVDAGQVLASRVIEMAGLAEPRSPCGFQEEPAL